MNWHVYILKCPDGRLYIGVTTDISRRLKQHRQGQGAAFTRTFSVDELCYSETFLNKSEAFSREIQLKKWTHKKKLALIAGDKELLKKL